MVLQRQNSRELDESKDDVFVESPVRYLGLLGRVGRYVGYRECTCREECVGVYKVVKITWPRCINLGHSFVGH